MKAGVCVCVCVWRGGDEGRRGGRVAGCFVEGCGEWRRSCTLCTGI